MTAPRDLAQQMAEKSDQDLLAMFASPDDWTAEALDASKTELQKRGIDSHCERPPSGHPPEIDGHDDRPDVYEFFGTDPNEDARLLLDAFVSDGVSFTLDANKMGVADLPPIQAANGGTFGAGVRIAVGVHIDDFDRAMEIRQRVFKILP